MATIYFTVINCMAINNSRGELIEVYDLADGTLSYITYPANQTAAALR